jgi:peroxiredoxin
MSKGLTPGTMLPDFTLPDETGTTRRVAGSIARSE